MINNNKFTFDITHNANLIKKNLEGLQPLLDQLPESNRATDIQMEATQEIVQLSESLSRCGNIAYMSKCMESSAVKTILSALSNCFRILFNKATAESKLVTCILGPMFTDEKISDGYIRRIKNIDALLPESTLRVYVFKDTLSPWPSLTYFDENHVLFTYNDTLDAQSIFHQITDAASFIYCHSIHPFDKALFGKSLPTFMLDLHGAVPEEMALLTKDQQQADEYGHIERVAVAQASIIIAVTNKMVTHLQEKYPEETQDTEFLVIPIFDVDITAAPQALPTANKSTVIQKPCIIYAGGAQEWQLIDTMFDAIEAQPSNAYKIFLPETSRFNDVWGTRAKPNDLETGTRSPEELKQDYAESTFGFILRDDSVVNHVACPTKLIEYLANGIIPIVKSPHIGDFENDKFAYVSLEDFLTNSLPDQKEQARIVAKNFDVILLQQRRFLEGEKRLQQLFQQFIFVEQKGLFGRKKKLKHP